MQTKVSLDLDDAVQLLTSAQASASERGVALSIAVVDDAGLLLAFNRMKSARSHTVDLAMRKARSAAMTGIATKLIEQAVRAGMIGSTETAGSGGVPVIIQGQCAGAVGISGAMPDVDDAIALLAVTALASPDE
ncbi:MAG: GlcG/HbpS family heme-binding protein [Telluria sp.]